MAGRSEGARSRAAVVIAGALYPQLLPFLFRDYVGSPDYLIISRARCRALVGPLLLSLGP